MGDLPQTASLVSTQAWPLSRLGLSFGLHQYKTGGHHQFHISASPRDAVKRMFEWRVAKEFMSLLNMHLMCNARAERIGATPTASISWRPPSKPLRRGEAERRT